MADKSDEESVLGSLPATRPTRLGTERRKSTNGKAAAAKQKTAAAQRAPKAASAKQKAAAKRKTAPKKKASSARSKAASGAERKPRPVRAGAPSLAEPTRRARTSEPPPRSTSSPPSGTELVTTAFQAAGELAQIGIVFGGRAVKRAVDRLRKP